MEYFVFIVLAIIAIPLTFIVGGPLAGILVGTTIGHNHTTQSIITPAISGALAATGLFAAGQITVAYFSISTWILLAICWCITILPGKAVNNYQVLIPVQLAVVSVLYYFVLIDGWQCKFTRRQNAQ